MSRVDEIETDILETWGDHSLPHALFRAIVYGFKPSVHRHLTLVALRRMSGTDIGLKEVYAAAEYLAGESLSLLERRFELLREHDAVDVPLESIYEATKTGVLLDPETGEAVKNWEKAVVPYYVPTDKLKGIVHGRESTG